MSPSNIFEKQDLLILADETGEILLKINHLLATQWSSILKEGHCYMITNLKVSFNEGKFNYTGHRFQVELQNNSIIQEQNDNNLLQMLRHFHIKAERDIFEVLDENSFNDSMTLISRTKESFFDLAGIIFKVKLKNYKYKDYDSFKFDVWVSNGENVIMISIFGQKAYEFRKLFDLNLWRKLCNGISIIEKKDVTNLTMCFRNLNAVYNKKWTLDLHVVVGEFFFKKEPPIYILPMIPRLLLNYSQTFLELPGKLDEFETIDEIIENAREGTYIIKGELYFNEAPIIDKQLKVIIRDERGALNAMINSMVARKLFKRSVDELITLRSSDQKLYQNLLKTKNSIQVYILLEGILDDQDVTSDSILNFVIQDIMYANVIKEESYEEGF